ncbi:kinase-like protein [Thelephora ganbajun]|uniref:Kinase-like protein n=1 Tax=Thelephora ganbajun TaxID=370292 RepID=A0ACB6Z002_THEGA|nr:kinase-like protein [Thelephora ganbajun]
MAPPTDPALQQIAQLDRTSIDFHDQLDNALHGQEYRECVPKLQDDDSVWLVNYLDEALGGPDHSASGKCLHELRTICGNKAILPASYTLADDQINVDSPPFVQGVMHKGTLDGLDVCVKRVWVFAQGNPQATAKIFCQEVVIWKYLEHPNILPLRGVTMNPLQLVSNWMPNGNLSDYIQNNPDADRLGLISNIAEGLRYLHTRNVIHGNLKGLNVLVDDHARARVADFGIAVAARNLNLIRPVTTQPLHALRWSAPEVLKGEDLNKKSDIFSFAMVMIEVFTGAAPFNNVSDLAAGAAIIRGERPTQPAHASFTPDLKALTENCWNDNPDSRPEMSEIAEVLANILHQQGSD